MIIYILLILIILCSIKNINQHGGNSGNKGNDSTGIVITARYFSRYYVQVIYNYLLQLELNINGSIRDLPEIDTNQFHNFNILHPIIKDIKSKYPAIEISSNKIKIGDSVKEFLFGFKCNIKESDYYRTVLISRKKNPVIYIKEVKNKLNTLGIIGLPKIKEIEKATNTIKYEKPGNFPKILNDKSTINNMIRTINNTNHPHKSCSYDSFYTYNKLDCISFGYIWK